MQMFYVCNLQISYVLAYPLTFFCLKVLSNSLTEIESKRSKNGGDGLTTSPIMTVGFKHIVLYTLILQVINLKMLQAPLLASATK